MPVLNITETEKMLFLSTLYRSLTPMFFFLQGLEGYELVSLKLLALYTEHLLSAEQIEPRYRIVTWLDLRSGQHNQTSGIYSDKAYANNPSI